MGNIQKHHFTMRATVIAVKGALAALAITSATYAAAGDEVYDLTHPNNTIQVGAGYVGDSSAKYGEYSNTLDESGLFAIISLDLNGGTSGYDSDSAFRWNVGVDAKDGVTVDVADQGTYRVKYSYDEIHRNYSDDYKTPYRGAGTNTLTLPGYPAVRASSTSNPANALANWQNIQAPNAVAGVPGGGPGYLIPAMMHQVDIGTERDRHGLDFEWVLSPEWKLTAGGKHESKEGTKLTGVAFGGPARGALLPEPIDSETDQFGTALAYNDKTAAFRVGYDGSLYNNSVNEWRVRNPFNSTLLDPFFSDYAQLSGAPDNEMHRFNLTGAYNFTPTTRLVANGHYQRMTQDEKWRSNWPGAWDIPVDSADAKVIDKNFNTTLTSRPIRDVALTASYKYEDRDNETPVEDFLYRAGDGNGAPSTFENDPLNKRTHKGTVEADYTFAPRQAVKIGYDREDIKRTNNADEQPWAVEETRENAYRAEYRNNLSETVTGRVGYVYSERRGMEGYEDREMPPAPGAEPFMPGFRQFLVSDRNRDKVRSSLDFQVTEEFMVQTGIEYNQDEFIDSPYGQQDAKSWVFKLDGNYQANENMSFNAFYTYEDLKAQLDGHVIGRASSTTIYDAPTTPGVCDGYYVASGHLPSDHLTDPCRDWSEEESTGIHSIGLGFKISGLPSSKFDFSGEVTYSHANEAINMDGGAYYGNGSNAASPAFNNVWLPAEDFPDITTRYLDVHLAGEYEIDPTSSVRVDYYYGMLHTKDWQYDAYTNSDLGPVAIPSFIGTGMESPNYSVHVIGASYIFNFE